jgi:hypothetical protein
MSVAFKQQQRDDLRQRVAVLFARRGQLEAERNGAADAAAVNEQIKRLDSDLEVLARDLANAERVLRTAT